MWNDCLFHKIFCDEVFLMSSITRWCATLACSVMLLLGQSNASALPLQSEIQPNNQNGRTYGYAQGKKNSADNYTEVFHDDPLNKSLRVSYWSPNRKAIAYKQMVFGETSNVPRLFEFIDYRRGRGVRVTVSNSIANVKSIRRSADGTETIRSDKSVKIDENTVIDASFHRFIVSDWDRLVDGKTIKVKFMRLDKASFVPLKIKRQTCESGSPDNICLKVSIDNIVLETMLPGFYMDYDNNKNLIRYAGFGPITTAKGKTHTAEINYKYVQDN